MSGLFLTHALEHLGGCGIIFAQAIGEIAVNAFVFFFQSDGEGQDFTFGQAVEIAHVLF